MNGLNKNIDYIYVIAQLKDNQINFNSIYPIIPDYLWGSNHGLSLR